MLTITNDKRSVADYVVEKMNGSYSIKRNAIKLYKLNLGKEPETILNVMQMLTEMYWDFIWTCGYSEDETAKMNVELEQFINESIEILS